MQCVICDKELKEAFEGHDGFQPSYGTAFLTHGHYGSTVFDPMDGSFLELAICDGCLVKAADKGQVVTGEQSPRIVEVQRKAWVPRRPGHRGGKNVI